MPQIKIQHRYEPFSHQPGIECLLPSTTFSFQFFPQKILIKNVNSIHSEIIGLLSNSISAPIQNYLVTCHIEKKMIKIEGKANQEFFRFIVLPHPVYEGFILKNLRTPSNFKWHYEGNLIKESFQNEIAIYNPQQKKKLPNSLEKLHFGITKKQDWELVKRRCLMEEILPFWFLLGQMFLKNSIGNRPSLYQQLLVSIESRDKLNLFQEFKNLFMVGFKGILVPRLFDEEFQGFKLPAIDSDYPLSLLTYGYEVIRKLFFEERKNELLILPVLPPELHHGRMINIQSSFGSLDLEWTKKTIRRLIFKCSQNCSLSFLFQKRIKSFRINKDVIKSGNELHFEKNKVYFFDNFKC